MTPLELLIWFRELDARADNVPHSFGVYLELEAAQWLAEAASALTAAFPADHPCRIQWRQVFAHADRQDSRVRHGTTFAAGAGIFRAARAVLETGRLGSLIDGVRADTLAEVLEQAMMLLPKFHIAAAVLAGGALETHLLHLCQRHAIVPAGDGSIAKYDGAVAQARNAGTVTVYSVTDGKLIGGWGGMRNDAAHTPTKFPYNAENVRGMVDGILQFIARVP